ncbi:MAG: TolC family protein [Treponema sp.]
MRKICAKRLMPALLLFCLNAAFAQDAATERQDALELTLEEAISSALANNTGIKNAKSALDLLKTKHIFSWNGISPSIKLNGSYTDDLKNEVSALSLSGTVNVALSANLYSEIQGARLNYEKGKLSYEQTQRSVECSVRKAFYGLLYERENIALQKRNLETSETQFRQNQEKFRNGSVSELDALSSRVNYEQKKPAVEQAELTFENDLDAFKQLIGIRQDVKVDLKGSLNDALAIGHVELPQTESGKTLPSVADAEHNVKIAKNALLSSRFHAYSPSISGGYTYGKSKTSAFDKWTETNQLNVGVSIPLDGALPWSQSAVGIKSAKTSLAEAQENLENEKTAAAVKTAGYIRKINQAVSQIDSLKANVELADQSYKMARAAYDYGRTDLLSLQNAADKLLSAEVSLKSQAYTLISTVCDLEQTLGVEFGTLGRKRVGDK